MLNINDLDHLINTPVSFLYNNIIFTPSGPGGPGPSIQRVAFGEPGFATPAGFESARIVPGDESSIYYLPWREDSCYSINLSIDFTTPSIMLTGRLTGCAMGTQLVNGVFRVYHCNLQTPEGRTDPTAQSQALRDLGATVNLNKQGYMLDREDYQAYNNNKSANVVGVRRDNMWNIYAQLLESDMNGIITVKQVIHLV